MSFLITKKGSLKLIQELDLNDIKMQNYVIDFMGHDYQIYHDAQIDVFYDGFEYQNEGIYLKISDKKE